MTSIQEEIPADIEQEARSLAAYARAMRDQPGVSDAIAVALLTERRKHEDAIAALQKAIAARNEALERWGIGW